MLFLFLENLQEIKSTQVSVIDSEEKWLEMPNLEHQHSILTSAIDIIQL
jgi:hypothetical protein